MSHKTKIPRFLEAASSCHSTRF